MCVGVGVGVGGCVVWVWVQYLEEGDFAKCVQVHVYGQVSLHLLGQGLQSKLFIYSIWTYIYTHICAHMRSERVGNNTD